MKSKHKLITLFVLVLIVILVLTVTSTKNNNSLLIQKENGCDSSQLDWEYTPVTKRLAEDVQNNWGLTAINRNVPTIEQGNNKVVVAVIDTGVSLTTNQIMSGYNAIDDSRDTLDTGDHGTYIASIILKVAPQAYILPIKVIDENGEQDPRIIAKGIEWAISQGADIINLSLGMPNEDIKLKEAIVRSTSLGIPVISSTGNKGKNALSFPANMSSVISVIARDINNVDAAFSNKSSCKKSISAPGVTIYLEDKSFSGTSFATAYVTGTVALMKSINKDVDVKTVIKILEDTSVDGNDFSYGLIQVDKAISKLINSSH